VSSYCPAVGLYYDPSSGANYTMMTSDSRPPAEESIIIGNGVARVRRLAEGDLVSFRSSTGTPVLLKVEKILPYESELVAADLIIMTERDFRVMFDFPGGRATDLAITVRNRSELTTIAAKIAQQFPDTRPILNSEILRTTIPSSTGGWHGDRNAYRGGALLYHLCLG